MKENPTCYSGSGLGVKSLRAVARTPVSGTENIEIKSYPAGTCSKFFEIDLFVNKAKN